MDIKRGVCNLIDGKWAGASSGKTFLDLNPATQEAIGHFPLSAEKEIEQAVAAARRALDGWRKMPVARRGEILHRAQLLLKERKEELARIETIEMGKVLKEARGDVQEAIDTGFYYAGEGRRLFGQTTTSELPDKFSMTVRTPVGVCGLIAPWNFPIAIPSWKVFPALICGNTVVFKPAEDTPASATHFVNILQESGLPDGVLNLVHGGPKTGQMLVRHAGIDLISFTGSSEVGAKIGGYCSGHHKKCSLEMGGKNAQIVMEDADLDLALEGALWGAFGTSGQRCTATSRLIVHEVVYKKFTEMLVERAKRLKIGNGLDESVEMGPIVNAKQLRNIHRYVEIGCKNDRAILLLGGKILRGGELKRGYFYPPTIFANGHPRMIIAQEEIFGPVALLMKVRSFEEAIRVLNSTTYGLSGSIYTRDINRIMQAIRDMETGITYINSPTIGAEVHLPFGGVKHTGNGHREAGPTVLDIFSEWKAVYIDYSGKLQKAQMDVD
jgi:alpha-ketoglutaric semialdehyde dehydrogenase